MLQLLLRLLLFLFTHGIHYALLIEFYRYSLMALCWEVEPTSRPTFSEIVGKIQSMLRTHEVRAAKYMFLTLVLNWLVCIIMYM